jgi:hypothetical protein
MREARKSGARVRGTCKAGHVTERLAGADRITWTGPCSNDGCDLNVRCKRVSTAESSDDKEKTKSRVRRVESYERPSKRARVADKRVGTDEPGVDGRDPDEHDYEPGDGSPKEGSGATQEPGFEHVDARGPDDDDADGIFPGWS